MSADDSLDRKPSAALTPAEWRYLSEHRVARLATVDPRGHPQVVPICFAVHAGSIYSALDEKPKRVPPTRLRRVRNLIKRPAVGLLVDDYSENWDDLAYLLIAGRAALIDPGQPEHATAILALREKYPQYATMAIETQPVIRIIPTAAHHWAGRPDRFQQPT